MKTCPNCGKEIPSFLTACGKLGCIIAVVSETTEFQPMVFGNGTADDNPIDRILDAESASRSLSRP